MAGSDTLVMVLSSTCMKFEIANTQVRKAMDDTTGTGVVPGLCVIALMACPDSSQDCR